MPARRWRTGREGGRGGMGGSEEEGEMCCTLAAIREEGFSGVGISYQAFIIDERERERDWCVCVSLQTLPLC